MTAAARLPSRVGSHPAAMSERRSSTGRRRLVAGAVLLLLSGCEPPSWAEGPRGPRYFDSTGAYPQAGVSARLDVQISPMIPSRIGPDTTGRAYALYRARCGSCHAVPDPAMKTSNEWAQLVRRMRRKTEYAGVLPPTSADADSVLAFLGTHSDERSLGRPGG